MGIQSVLNKELLSAESVTGNGTFDLFVSRKFEAPNDFPASSTALELMLTYGSNLPDPEVTNTKYSLSCIVETEDENGNWYPIHNQFRAFVKEEHGAQHILRLDPGVLVLDPGIPNDIWNGVRTIAVESIKQGTLPDDFRFRIQVNEGGYDAAGAVTPSAFQSVELTAAFRAY